MTPFEIVERLRRLASDEEIGAEARSALARVCDPSLPPDVLYNLMIEAYATRSGLSTNNHLCRVVCDAVPSAAPRAELPPHASGAV